jgi:membrane protease YdiL (CAAX protease family)
MLLRVQGARNFPKHLVIRSGAQGAPAYNAQVPFSLTTVAIILSYTWLFEPVWTGTARAVPVVLVVVLAIAHAMRTGDWGLEPRAFLPALWRALLVTLVGVVLILVVGDALDTLHKRRAVGRSLLYLFVWGAGQQFALQTVLLREAGLWMPRGAAVIVAAGVFGAVHLPNPFLAPITFAAALVWCWIYSRYPNIIPLAISHALGTEAVRHAFDDDLTGRLRIGYSYLQYAIGEE